jgi:hypothetical protein
MVMYIGFGAAFLALSSALWAKGSQNSYVKTSCCPLLFSLLYAWTTKTTHFHIKYKDSGQD